MDTIQNPSTVTLKYTLTYLLTYLQLAATPRYYRVPRSFFSRYVYRGAKSFVPPNTSSKRTSICFTPSP